MGKKWTVTLVVEDGFLGSEPFDDGGQVAEFVRWKVADGSVVEVVEVRAEERMSRDQIISEVVRRFDGMTISRGV